ncbi:MAG: ATP-binding protein [Thermoanaerobaculia bacterium]
MAHQPELHLRIASRFDELDLVDRLIDGFLEYLGWDAEDGPNVTLAVREAAANAVQHGNRLDASIPAEIYCTVGDADSGGDSWLLVEVVDQGEGFDIDGLPDPLAPENLLKPTGRGILLIRNFMDSVTFEFPEAGGTRVSMGKRVPASVREENSDSNEENQR